MVPRGDAWEQDCKEGCADGSGTVLRLEDVVHSLVCLSCPPLESASRFCAVFSISRATLWQRQINIKGVQKKSPKPLELFGI